MKAINLDLGFQMNDHRNFNGEHLRKSFGDQLVRICTLQGCYLEVKEAFPSSCQHKLGMSGPIQHGPPGTEDCCSCCS